jgi:tRNA U34 5-methylaminomethyl-2-thiouridine-forming methyltransferase MnmC
MTSHISPPPGHEWIETQDGSSTLFSHAFQEAAHSTHGARAETLVHYVKGCQIVEKLMAKGSLHILEVGFGLGVGFLETFGALRGLKGQWHFVSLELDLELLEWWRVCHREHEFLGGLRWSGNVLEVSSGNVSLSILGGDGRKTLPEYTKLSGFRADAIYQDAYSPKKNPTLWTQEWFELLKNCAQEEVILSTYSASTRVRKSMLAAGWRLWAGERFGPKRTSTRASLLGESDPEILLHLDRSPVGPLRDGVD